MTTNRPLSLFISSKMTELADERHAVQNALSEYDMRGWLWEKDAGARPEPIDSTYLKEVETCDLYIGLFWLGYGPYTIEEYEHARKHHKDCLIYEKHIDIDKRDPQLQAFLDNIQQVKNPHGLTVARFETPAQFASQVKKDVMRLLTTHFRETRKQPSTPPGKRWHPPKPPAFDKAFVGRRDELDELITELSAGKDATVTGKTMSAALQGMGGIGKTYLARKLAIELQNSFPGGVIWIEVGPQVTSEASAQAPLRKLAGDIPEGALATDQLYPEQVAALIEEMAPGRMLVIFDDVWHQAALRFLARALPGNAVRLVTTRYANIAQTLGGKMVNLDRLKPEDGLALLEDRLDCHDDTTYKDDLEKLVTLLDGHALALDITAALIKKRSSRVQAVQMVLNNLRQGIGRGKLDSLVLPPSEERDENLEKSLALSYEHMTAEQQIRFRTLGVFAAEAPISIGATAAVWNMDNLDDAQNALVELVDLAFLTEIADKSSITYRQHGLLRVYAHALLEKANELSTVSHVHAQYYTGMVEHTERVDYAPLDQHLPNLLAALEWVADNEPAQFMQLLDESSQFLDLRGQSELLEIYLPKAITAAIATRNKGRQANLLQSLGDLESRLGNLDQARSHYDAALPLYRSERARLGEANLLVSLGDLERRLGHIDQARSHYDAALPLYRTERDRLGEANLLVSLGDLERRLGHIDQARSHYDAALPLYRTERNRLGEASVYRRLGDMFLAQEEWLEAKTYYEKALPMFVAVGEPIGQANALFGLGRARFELGDHNQGIQNVQQAVELYRFVQNKEGVSYMERVLAKMRTQMEEQ